MTEEEKVDEILNTIRRVHGIATSPKDPIFSLLTANEIVMAHHMAKIDLLFVQQMQDMEAARMRFQNDAKELAEIKISKAVNNAFDRLDAYKKEIDETMEYARRQSEISTEQAKNGNRWWVSVLIPILTAAAGYAAALFII